METVSHPGDIQRHHDTSTLGLPPFSRHRLYPASPTGNPVLHPAADGSACVGREMYDSANACRPRGVLSSRERNGRRGNHKEGGSSGPWRDEDGRDRGGVEDDHCSGDIATTSGIVERVWFAKGIV